MEAYRTFASVYDTLMQEVPYGQWMEYILRLWDRFGLKPRLVADLGCGTGTLSVLLAQKGYEMIGIDASADMLTIASEKAARAGCEILLLNQPMEDFELFGTVDSIISVFDSINYIIEPDELAAVFRLVKNYLNEGGLFVFDVNTLYKYERILADNTFAENYDDCAYIWDNYYDRAAALNEYELNLFIQAQGSHFEKSVEYHYQRGYEIEELKALLAAADLALLAVYDAYTFEPPKEDSERIFFVCKG